MRPGKWHGVFVLILLSRLLPAPPALADATLELYGTFESMGVIVHLAAGDDPNGDATAEVAYRLAGSGDFQPGFPPSRVGGSRFVGSLFWLTPGTAYEIRVTLADPDGGPLDGAIVTGSAATRATLTVPSPSRSYTVSPSGSGSACTVGSPCTLSTAVQQAQAGEEVVLRGGVYYQGGFDLPRSGTDSAPIVFRNYPGETPVLDGGDPAAFTWTAQGGGVYQTTVNTATPHLVIADGQRLYPYQSLSDLQNLIWGIPGFYANGSTVTVRLAGNADPNAADLVTTRYNYAFYVGQRNHLYFFGLTFRHYGLNSYAKAIYFDGASDNWVKDCTFVHNDLGIGLKRASGRNVIEENTFSDTDAEWPWDAVKSGSQLETGGVAFYSPVTGRGNIVRYNIFHDYFDGFATCPESIGSAASNETDVYGNQVYRAGDDGLSSDGECSNVRIWGNTFHDVLVGISLAPVETGPVYAIRNVMYNLGFGNNSYPGLSFKFNYGGDPSGPMFLFHNTADAVTPDTSGLNIKSPGEWAMITTRNNVWSGTGYSLSNANTTQPVDMDHDALFTTQAGQLVRWGNENLNTLEAFRSATGQELHGINAAPVFAPAAGDYTLSGNSPLIDKAAFLPGVNDKDYHGAAPDIGAFEWAGPSVPD